ncbi:polyprenol monophosphomannose synthase [Streptomyces specialis]|uniref:polyprenol monophosphomannose synthase n=1 Tax=Streptomyces specialis TaxID=498367 RepID=UPI00073F0CDA|nr:polyprenol monophosphomannose synthase [Streptomyces specialis]
MPTYNEAACLPGTAAALLALPLPGLRLLIVDDDSPDGTGRLADELAAADPRVSVLHRTAKEGLGRAYAAGIGAALRDGPDYVAQMDADGSHRVEHLPELLGAALATGAGLVVGSRYVPGGQLAADWGARRRLLSACANLYATSVLGVPIRDLTAGYTLWSADALEDLALDGLRSAGYSFQVETKFLAVRAGHKVVEVPIRFEDRAHGTSKMDFATQRESALLPPRLRWDHRGRRRAARPQVALASRADI